MVYPVIFGDVVAVRDNYSLSSRATRRYGDND